MKKIFAFLLTSLLVAFAATALTSCIFDPKLEFELVDGGYRVSVGGAGSQSHIEIPSTYNDIPVKAIAADGFADCKRLESIVIPDSVEIIGSRAFEGCTSLASISLEDSVQRFGADAFRYCDSLTEVRYYGSPESWCDIAFGAYFAVPTCYGADLYFGDELVRELKIPDGTTDIKEYAFMGCRSLESVVIPESVTSIGGQVFYGCTSLKSIVIPDSLRAIGDSAFYNCTSLTDVTIPRGLHSIGRYTFYNCVSLSSIAIPETVGVIGEHAFAYCLGLTDVSLGESLRSIGGSAFRNCAGLTSIVIPVGVNNIAKNAFSGCNRLVEVINESQLDITAGLDSYGAVAEHALEVHDGESRMLDHGSYRFYPRDGAYYLIGYYGDDARVTLPESYNGEPYSINAYAFFKNGVITRVTIPSSVTAIGESAFEDCTELKRVEFSDGIETVGRRAFSGCTSLASLEIPDCVRTIAAYAFHNCTDLKSAVIGDGVTEIGASAFWGCTDLDELTIGKGVTSIGRAAFYGCEDLIRAELPDSVEVIGEAAFSACSSLSSIVIPAGIKEIGDGFLACYRLVEVINKSQLKITLGTDTLGGVARYAIDVHDGESRVTLQDEYLFYVCDDLIYLIGYSGDGAVLTLPDGYNGKSYHIAKNAFLYRENIARIVIPSAVESIGREAFNGCIGLKSVVIEKGVSRIGEAAFYGCTGLTNVYYKGTEADWAEIYIDWDNASLTKAKMHYSAELAD